MSQKEFNGRIIQKHDTSANWALAVNFVPKKGELILYTDLKKLKIGDGVTTVSNLPFTQADTSAIESAIYAAIDTKASQGDLNAHIGDSVKHITSAERTAWNSKANEADLQAHISNSTIHVTSTDKSVWNAKQDAISDLNTIRSGAEAGATAVQPGDLADVATSGDYNDLINTPTPTPDRVFIADANPAGGATTYAEVTAAIAAGKAVFAYDGARYMPLVSQANNIYRFEGVFANSDNNLIGSQYKLNQSNQWIYSQLKTDYDTLLNKPDLNTKMNVSDYDANSAVKNAGGIVSYVDANGGKIDHIKVNNAEQTITDKTVNITVPTELNDLTDDSTHRLVTDAEKANWNAKYAKPSTGIPKTDLAAAVQTSLGLADTALQSFTETDPTVPSWAKQTSKPTYTYTEVGADAAGAANTALTNAKAYTDQEIAALPSPMVFKGTLGTGGTITSLPAAAASNTGHTYKVITAGTYASQAAKIGDMFISTGSAWTYVPSGDEPSGTVTNVATGTGLTGGPISTSGTISLSSASIASLAKADTAVQPSSLATVATTGDYNDLENIPPSYYVGEINSATYSDFSNAYRKGQILLLNYSGQGILNNSDMTRSTFVFSGVIKDEDIFYYIQCTIDDGDEWSFNVEAINILPMEKYEIRWVAEEAWPWISAGAN